jgi:hypothetical protein
MHVQKNVFERLIGTLLDMKGKTKEGLNSRLDMVQLVIKKELHPARLENGKYHLLAASYNLKILQYSSRGTSQRPTSALDNGAFDQSTH